MPAGGRSESDAALDRRYRVVRAVDDEHRARHLPDQVAGSHPTSPSPGPVALAIRASGDVSIPQATQSSITDSECGSVHTCEKKNRRKSS